MKTILTLLLAFASLTICSQAPSKFALFLDAGYTFNNEVTLNEQLVKNSDGIFMAIGGTYRLFNYKKFHTEIGLATKMVYARGEANNKSFDARTLRIGVPVNFVFRLSDKWSFSAGSFFQNNVDLEEFDLRLRDKYCWRVNLTPEIRYQIHPRYQLSLKGHFNLRDLPDPYILNDPSHAFSIGLLSPF